MAGKEKGEADAGRRLEESPASTGLGMTPACRNLAGKQISS